MADLRPFRGLRYDPSAGEPADLMAPPYDVISPQQHVVLCQRSVHNIVRVILGERRSAHEAMPDDWYGAAAERLHAWQADGVLITDDAPAFYIYTQAFEHDGRRHRRKLLLGALKLEPYERRVVLPHEATMPGPKADRLRLMQTCRANLSPVLTFCPDRDARVNDLLESLTAVEPTVAFADEDGIEHELRCVFDGDAQDALRQALDPLQLYIADGHHRYETALTYQQLEASSRRPEGGMPADLVLIACMSAADPGMVIRPTHRVVAWSRGPGPDAVLSAAGQCFDVRRLDGASVEQALAAANACTTAGCFVVYAGAGAGYALLSPRVDEAVAGSADPPSSLVRSLPAAVFGDGFVARLLGGHAPEVEYTADADKAVRRVDEGTARLAGLLPPVRPSELMAAVNAGELMPPKSTYFWPKPLTGMVMRSLSSE